MKVLARRSIVSLCDIEKDEVQALIQDAIFSRGPNGVKRTGIFLGGREMHLAMDMIKICRESMVPPFEVSCFADPSCLIVTLLPLTSFSPQINMRGTLDSEYSLIL